MTTPAGTTARSAGPGAAGPGAARSGAARPGSVAAPGDSGADLRAKLVAVAAERDALRAQLEGDIPAATRWLQRKVWRQAAALDVLNRRVVTQRFVLRTLDELGRSLTAAEYRAARSGIANDKLRQRIDDPA
jgi:hypothetical protein